jgi:hypothetical protein
MDKRKDKINSALPTRSTGGRYLGIATQSAPNGAGWQDVHLKEVEMNKEVEPFWLSIVTEWWCNNCQEFQTHNTTLPSFFTEEDIATGRNKKQCLNCETITSITTHSHTG